MTATPTLPTERHVPADLPDRIQHYVDGAFVDSADGDMFEVLDPVSNECERMTICDLRHTAARLAVSSGANINAVQRRPGHAAAAMTLGRHRSIR